MLNKDLDLVLKQYNFIMREINQKEDKDEYYYVIFDDDESFTNRIFNLRRSMEEIQNKICVNPFNESYVENTTRNALNKSFQEIAYEINEITWGIRKREKIESGWFDEW